MARRERLSRSAPLSLSWIILPLSIALSCRSSDTSRAARHDSSDSSAVRPVGDLPPEYADLWNAWLAQDPNWSERRAAALEDPALTRFLVQNLAREMIRAWRAGQLTTTRSERLGPFERARSELLRIGAPSTPILAELSSLAASDIAELCLQLLIAIGRPSVEPVLAQLERDDSSTARRRAAIALASLPPAGALERELRESLLGRAHGDPEPIVRGRALLALGVRAAADEDPRPTRRVLEQRLAEDDQTTVRAAAADALARLGDPWAVPALVAYYEEMSVAPDIGGMRAALDALSALTGVEESLDARGWRDWWREHRSEVLRRDELGRE